MNDSRHAVLCVDDEPNILHALKRLLRKEDYRLLTANSTKEAIQVLRKEEVQVVISDQRMPEMSGVEFLAKLKENFPDIIRIVLTGYTDVESITESINKGHIFKFLLKPWNDQHLKLEIRQALEQYELVHANRRLNEQILQKNQELKNVNEELERRVQERTKELELQNHALELTREVLEDLPIAIVGVGSDGVIVLMNRKARELPMVENTPRIGRKLKSCFSNDLSEEVNHLVSGGRQGLLSRYPIGECMFDIHAKSLTGRFLGNGVVLVLMPAPREKET